MALAAVLVAVLGLLGTMVFHIGAQPESLLYANLDLKESAAITAQLDQAGIKYQLKGDGATIMVGREEVAKARLMLANKGLPSSGSVGYEIFDSPPPLGQTEFMENINNQRALEGELARTIRAEHGISMARVLLVMPRRELFQEEAAAPTASVQIGMTSTTGLGADQVNAIRHLVASAVPNLKPTNITIIDDHGRLLASGGEDDAANGAMGAQKRTEVEDSLRKRIKDIVEGIVGPGNAHVQVTADLDLTTQTKEEVKYDPDGQVVRSTGTTTQKESSADGSTNGQVSAAANTPGGQQTPGVGASGNNSDQSTETTNYEISSTKTTTVMPSGTIKHLAVSVAVDDQMIPSKDGKGPDTYKKRTPEELKQIEALVKSAMGYVDLSATDPKGRKDDLAVINPSFNHAGMGVGGASAKPPLFDFDKNDILRGVEMLILLIVSALIIFFVAKPLLKYIATASPTYVTAGDGSGQMVLASGGGAMASGSSDGQVAALAGGLSPFVPTDDGRIDIARIEGQVKASSVKKVSEFVDRHPDESVAILRAWLHDN